MQRPFSVLSFLATTVLTLASTSTVLRAQGRPDIVWARGGHAGQINSVAYSPDGSLVASASLDNTVKIWRTGDSTLVRTLNVPVQDVSLVGVNALAFSPDGTTLATASGSDSFPPSNANQAVRLWRVSDGTLLLTMLGHTANVKSVAFAPNGLTIASGSADKTVKIWRVSDGVLLKTLTGHTDTINTVRFSDNGSLLASGSADKTIRLWQTSNWALQRTLTGHTAPVNSVDFSPDSQTLASAAGAFGIDDTKIRLWRVSNGSLLRTLTGHTAEIWGVAFSNDGQRLASTGDTTVRLWQFSNGALLKTATNGLATYAIVWSPDGTDLLTGDLTVRRGTDLTILGSIAAESGSVPTVAFTPDGQTFLEGSNDRNAGFWRVSDSAFLRDAHARRGVNAIAVSPDGQLLAVSSTTFIQLFRTSDGVQTLQVAGVGQLAFSRDSQTFAVSGGTGYNKTVNLFRVSDGTALFSLAGGGSDVAFSPDGQVVAAAGRTGLSMWRLSDGVLLRTLTGGATGLAYSPDGSLIASSGGPADPTIRIWRATDGVLQRTITNAGEVSSLVFTTDGQDLITSGDDPVITNGIFTESAGTIKFWRVSDGALLKKYDKETHAGTGRVAVSPNGKLFSYCYDATFVIANVPAL